MDLQPTPELNLISSSFPTTLRHTGVTRGAMCMWRSAWRSDQKNPANALRYRAFRCRDTYRTPHQGRGVRPNRGECRSRASVRASARLSDVSVSSCVSPLARALDQIRRTDAGDQGRAASDTHRRKGAGNPSNAAIGSPDLRFRRRLLCPKFRVTSPPRDRTPDPAPEPAGFRRCLQSGASDAATRTPVVPARGCRAAGSVRRFER